ncbi:hypothetical protein [Amycolatopsis suaedae]|nr:hypothetical protein [Amycolatopsis suaedae]
MSTNLAPRWAVRVAHLIPLLTLPVALWRLAWVFELPIGWEAAFYTAATDDWHDKLYLLGLSVLTEALALLSLGLVRRWGEVVPRWVPLLGGRPIPPLAATVPAGLGAAGLIVLWTPLPWMFLGPAQGGAPDGNGWELLMAVCYLPQMLWGPLLALLTVAYHRRRKGLSLTSREAVASVP